MTPEELRRLASNLETLGRTRRHIVGELSQAAAALREYAESLELEPKPVASIYISANGNREVDDWRCDLPVGRNILYTHPPRTKPVAYMTEYFSPDCGPQYEIYKADDMGWRNKAEYTPLFTHPPRSEPPKMTESDVRNMAEWWPSFDRAGVRLALAVADLRDKQWRGEV